MLLVCYEVKTTVLTGSNHTMVTIVSMKAVDLTQCEVDQNLGCWFALHQRLGPIKIHTNSNTSIQCTLTGFRVSDIETCLPSEFHTGFNGQRSSRGKGQISA